jgi:hypothetical protein
LRQFTPRAIKQFEKDKEKTPDDVKKEIKEKVQNGELSLPAAKELFIKEIKKLETAKKKKLFSMEEKDYKADLKERLKEKELTVEEAKAEVQEYIKTNKEKIQDEMSRGDEKGFIHSVSLYAKALGTDPITAFQFIFDKEKIRRIDNKTIIVERMPWEESREIRKEKGATNELILDHTLPLQLGGSNQEDNLKLVSLEEWQEYTIIENYLGDRLRQGTIKKKEAQKLILDYKAGKISGEEILKMP